MPWLLIRAFPNKQMLWQQPSCRLDFVFFRPLSQPGREASHALNMELVFFPIYRSRRQLRANLPNRRSRQQTFPPVNTTPLRHTTRPSHAPPLQEPQPASIPVAQPAGNRATSIRGRAATIRQTKRLHRKQWHFVNSVREFAVRCQRVLALARAVPPGRGPSSSPLLRAAGSGASAGRAPYCLPPRH